MEIVCYSFGMKVILIKDVRRVGQAGQIISVHDGYAINFLFPQKLAEPATEEKIKQVEANKASRDAAAQKERDQLDAKISSLRGKKVVIQARATEKGGLFKSLGQKEIAKAILAEHSLEIPEDCIVLEPIKTLGDHSVSLRGPSQKSDLTVTAVAGI